LQYLLKEGDTLSYDNPAGISCKVIHFSDLSQIEEASANSMSKCKILFKIGEWSSESSVLMYSL